MAHVDLVWGAKYRKVSDGNMVTFGGIGGSKQVILFEQDDSWFKLPYDDFAQQYVLTDKHDHENFCCTVHELHALPHTGCLFR